MGDSPQGAESWSGAPKRPIAWHPWATEAAKAPQLALSQALHLKTSVRKGVLSRVKNIGRWSEPAKNSDSTRQLNKDKARLRVARVMSIHVLSPISETKEGELWQSLRTSKSWSTMKSSNIEPTGLVTTVEGPHHGLCPFPSRPRSTRGHRPLAQRRAASKSSSPSPEEYRI